MKRSTARLWYLFPAGLFLILAAAVATKTQIFFDLPVITYLGHLRSPSLTLIFKLATDIGSTPFVLVFLGIIGLLLWRKKNLPDAVILLSGVLGAGVLDGILKILFGRPRPEVLTHLVTETGRSFPSGHSMVSSALAFSCVLLLWKTRWRWAAVTAGLAYVLLVGISRIYLGVHYPSDVVAGWCVSALWVGLVGHWLGSRGIDRHGEI